MLQCGANLKRELFQGIGLLYKIRVKIEHFMVEHGLAGIAGNEQELP